MHAGGTYICMQGQKASEPKQNVQNSSLLSPTRQQNRLPLLIAHVHSTDFIRTALKEHIKKKGQSTACHQKKEEVEALGQAATSISVCSNGLPYLCQSS